MSIFKRIQDIISANLNDMVADYENHRPGRVRIGAELASCS